MQLKEIYRPIEKELTQIEQLLKISLEGARNKSISEIGNYLLATKGKRLRPALVILSAKATLGQETKAINYQLAKIASSVELIHMASLIHDDVIDDASLRHNSPTINSRCGQDVSIALGDYLYSKAFELISSCGNIDILSCISCATRLMCEGELIQVCERDNLVLLKERYITIVKKKTASLFTASCLSGAMVFHCPRPIQGALKQYGLNFGIAFQIVDDCLDLISQAKDLGKSPGADFKMGELTLPVLNLLTKSKDKDRLISLIRQKNKQEAFVEIKQRFINSPAFLKTKEDALYYIQKAKRSLGKLSESCFKESLFTLTDYIGQRL